MIAIQYLCTHIMHGTQNGNTVLDSKGVPVTKFNDSEMVQNLWSCNSQQTKYSRGHSSLYPRKPKNLIFISGYIAMKICNFCMHLLTGKQSDYKLGQNICFYLIDYRHLEHYPGIPFYCLISHHILMSQPIGHKCVSNLFWVCHCLILPNYWACISPKECVPYILAYRPSF